MTLFKNHFTSFSILLITSLLISCTTTITKPKDPIFSVEESSILSELNDMVTCENISFAGKEITKNGKTSSILEVSMINGKEIPKDKNQKSELAKSIALNIKKSLENQSAFDKIIVLFLTKSKDGGISKKLWTTHEFISEEL